jgi:hypothetical protein
MGINFSSEVRTPKTRFNRRADSKRLVTTSTTSLLHVIKPLSLSATSDRSLLDRSGGQRILGMKMPSGAAFRQAGNGGGSACNKGNRAKQSERQTERRHITRKWRLAWSPMTFPKWRIWRKTSAPEPSTPYEHKPGRPKKDKVLYFSNLVLVWSLYLCACACLGFLYCKDPLRPFASQLQTMLQPKRPSKLLRVVFAHAGQPTAFHISHGARRSSC